MPTPQRPFVYATDSNAQLPQYSADDGGALTALTPAFAPATATSSGIAASPDGHTIYAVDQPTDDVSQYAVGADGRLTLTSVAALPAGSAPFDIALASRRPPTYVANQSAARSPSSPSPPTEPSSPGRPRSTPAPAPCRSRSRRTGRAPTR